MVNRRKEYGSGSSRDWAAKGMRLLGWRGSSPNAYEPSTAATSVGMGVLPLEFRWEKP